MTCMECRHPKTEGAGSNLAKYGFVGCAKKPIFYTRSIRSTQNCTLFEQADAAQVERMAIWARGLK